MPFGHQSLGSDTSMVCSCFNVPLKKPGLNSISIGGSSGQGDSSVNFPLILNGYMA